MIPINEPTVCKGGQNVPPEFSKRPPAPAGSGGTSLCVDEQYLTGCARSLSEQAAALRLQSHAIEQQAETYRRRLAELNGDGEPNRLDELGWMLRDLFKSSFPEETSERLQRAISDPLIEGDTPDLTAVQQAIEAVTGKETANEPV